jgi:hypothetical protein
MGIKLLLNSAKLEMKKLTNKEHLQNTETKLLLNSAKPERV